MRLIQGLIAVIFGLVVSTQFSVDPMTMFAIACIISIPSYFTLSIISRSLGVYNKKGGIADFLWELGFLIGILIAGGGLGMMFASSLGWSMTSHQFQYLLVITVFVMVGLVLGYHFTSPVGRQTAN